MGRPSRFSREVRERAVRMVEEQRETHASEWAVLQSVAPKLGCPAETLRKWVRHGDPPGCVYTQSLQNHTFLRRIPICTSIVWLPD